MASDKITIDRELFERLTHAAIELEAEWHWKAGETRRGHADTLDKLASLVREAVAIRDAPPQMMTDGEREAWVEAGKYEVQLQAAAQRLQAAMKTTEAVDAMGVVTALDELIATHAKETERIHEAQRKIIAWMTRTDVDTDVNLWRGVGDVPAVTIGITAFDSPEDRTTALDKSRCLLVQIAEAIEEWKRIHLPASALSE